MPCNSISSVASSTRSSAHFTVQIKSPILKFPELSRASLIRHLLYKQNRIGGKEHRCLAPLPVFTLLVHLASVLV